MPHVSRPTDEQIYGAALLARRNARRFFKDAEVLRGAQSYGHAYGMLVFAEEEAGKALIFRLFADGLLRNPEWLALATARHEAKHATMALTVMMRLLFFFMFGLAPHENMRAKRKKWLREGVTPGSFQIAYDHLRQASQDIPGTINTVADLIEELGDLGQLQAQRENGFFVDFDDSGEPSGPHQFDKSQYSRQVRLVRARLAAADDFLGGARVGLRKRRAANQVDPKMRKQIASFESFLFSKSGKNLVLEWLSSDQPKEIVRKIRQFAANEDNVEKVRSVVTEMLSKTQPAAASRAQLST